MQKVLRTACLAAVASALTVQQQRVTTPELASSSFLELPQVPVIFEDGAKGASAGAALIEESASASQGREGRVESLISAEQTALLSQEQALEQIAAQQAALAKQQEALKEREAKVEAEIAKKLGDASFAQVSSGSATASSSESGLGLEANLSVFQRIIQKSWKEQLISAGVYLSLTLVFGWIYGAYFTYEYPPLRKEPLVTRHGFSFGICDGFQCDPDSRICLFSFCCLPVRWADTASSPKVGYIRFWSGLFLFAILFSLNGLSYGITGLFLLILVVLNRQRIRQVYGMPNKTFETVLKDIGMWLFCIPCAAMQEAQEVEFVDPLGATAPRMMQMKGPLDGDKFLTTGSAKGGAGPGKRQHNTCC
eukprot:gb/GFBE01035214.1/.p1 GENE.gb/GFBE01035214.1/~~gb/GFBE01035214.1/.p1  ORF type:complete len:365 (+),score=101.23 gb/GFBE01035214.1/:1-1095(+)